MRNPCWTCRLSGVPGATMAWNTRRCISCRNNSGARRLMGRSSDQGFVLFADAPQAAVDSAVREALRRMKKVANTAWPIHPGCGTSRLTTGILASLTAIAAVSGTSRRDALNRLPYMMVLMMLTILISEPLGMALQKYFTTDGDPADMEILEITKQTIADAADHAAHHAVYHANPLHLRS